VLIVIALFIFLLMTAGVAFLSPQRLAVFVSVFLSIQKVILRSRNIFHPRFFVVDIYTRIFLFVPGRATVGAACGGDAERRASKRREHSLDCELRGVGTVMICCAIVRAFCVVV
jgi:hypothetical protein